MTRKDYVLIAAAIKQSFNQDDPGLRKALVLTTAKKIADALASDNSRFNKSTFLQACGFTDSDIGG